MDGIQTPTVLSIDIGTSSVRTQVYDATGTAIEGIGMQIPYSMTYTPDGGAFIALDELCEIVYQAIDRAVGDAENQSIPIAAVACCTFWHSLAGIGASGAPCTPLINWNDTRPETVLPNLIPLLDPATYTQRTGCPIHASYYPAKIVWLHRAMPEAAQQVRYWMSAGEYLLWQMTGRRACSLSMASATGLLDSVNCVWDEKALSVTPADLDQFLPLCDSSEGMPGMLPSFAQRWPALAHAIWYPALGDGACSNVGCGCSSPNRIAVMVGTSGAMRTVWRGAFRQPPSGLWSYRIDGQRPIQGGALSNGGNLLAWLYDTLDFSRLGISKDQPTALQDLDFRLKELPADGHGLTFLPFLAGQRSPRWNPHSTGVLQGLRLSTQPIHILQAGLEAVAFRFKLIHELLQNELSDDHVIVATGGGLLHSSAWVQILSDVLGREVLISSVSEASCRGAALMALESLGAIEDIAEVDFGAERRISPRSDAQAIYRDALRRHVEWENKILHT